MSASQFMDKQMMGLAGAEAQGGDLLVLLNHGEDHRSNGGGGAAAGGLKEEILPSYDFQPIRRGGSPSPVGRDQGGGWGSADSKLNFSNFRHHGSLDVDESSNVIREKSKETYDTAGVGDIDRTVKKYADILLHALEGVSSRLSQLECRTYNLESSLNDLKLCIGNNSGNTDGKLRQLENILREVQTGVQVIRDKQEIVEAQMQLEKLQTSKGDHQQPDNLNSVPSDSQHPPLPLPQQPLQQPAQPLAAPPPPLQIPSLPAPPPNAPLPPPPLLNPPVQFSSQLPQNHASSISSMPPPVQFSSQLPQNHASAISSMPQCESYLPPTGHTPAEVPQQHYQSPPQQSQLPPPLHYRSAPQLAQFSQPPQLTQPAAPTQLQPSLPHHPEESSSYMPPSETYPPSIHQPHLQTGPPAPHQIYGSTSNIYEPPASRPVSGQQPFPTGYGPSSGPSFPDSYPYSGSPSRYSSARESSPFSSSPAPSGSAYPRLPTAQILPQALPSGSSSASSTGNRVPIDDVVDKVTTMGFPRDLVKEAVRKLTENGQSVDLNVVLDKLMNDSDSQQRKGWFGR